MTPEQQQLATKESGRWTILQCVHVGGHLGATEEMVFDALRMSWPDLTRDWMRTQIAYLESRDLLEVERHELKPWRATLTRHGHDIVDYVVDVLPGINRPRKYWT